MGINFFIFVALGGALGSVLRALLSNLMVAQSQVATILVNIGGAFLIGFLTKWGSGHGSEEFFRAFWILGVCGGFTTFSTFGMDLYNLLQKESWGLGIGYMTANLLGTLVFIWIGFRAADITIS
jgi:CrcB protein